MDFLRRLFGSNDSPAKEQANDAAPAAASLDTMPGTASEETGPLVSDAPVDLIKTPPPTQAFGATRQLPPLESALARPNQHITYGQSSDTGMVRSNNQDSVLTFFACQGNTDNVPDFGLFVVADGMGGHHDGEKASALASRVLAEYVTTHIYLPMLKRKEDQTDADQPTISEILVEAVKTANDVVVRSIPEGGTTITATAVMGDLSYIVHVGDSRAYLITEEYGLEQITRDHSLVQRLIELDQLTPEEAAQHPQKNVLYRAIGQSDNLEIDTTTRRLPASSYLLLCSDGLWNTVPDTEITAIILNAASPQAACDRLVASANEHGGADNISAVLLKIPG
ncbi:MAG: serine/threonine-protein phosphatase [Anaerolineae bacterium]|nr:serine/threonine-protein phosphatase [Anaerolineae bacterium]